MKKGFLLLLSFVIMLSIFTTPISATENGDSVFLIRLHDYSGSIEEEGQIAKVCTVQEMAHFFAAYPYDNWNTELDQSKYDAAFFQENYLLFALVRQTGSSPEFEITSVRETATAIEVEIDRPEGPPSPDMASWFLVLERDRNTQEKELWVNAEKLVQTPYPAAPDHSFQNGVCALCGEKEPAAFVDVPPDAWYAKAVDYVAAHGLMNGIGGNQFAPEGTMTRAMLITVLWRYADEPEEGKNNFTDVVDGSYYAKAVTWAAKNGIVNGIGDNRFDPEGEVTREQLATILFRFAAKNNGSTTARADFSAFEDGASVSKYAIDALKWAVAEKIITGSGENGKLFLNPQHSATRSQVAAVLLRYIEDYPACGPDPAGRHADRVPDRRGRNGRAE